MQPYQQGELDGLCGLYCLINATKLIMGPLGKERSRELLQSCLASLTAKADLPYLVSRGMRTQQLLHALRKGLQPLVPLDFQRPFTRNSQVDLSKLWETAECFCNGGPRRVVMICMRTVNYSHWTLVRSVSSRQMLLFDSDGYRRIYRHHCTTNPRSAQCPVRLVPNMTLFLGKKPDKGVSHA